MDCLGTDQLILTGGSWSGGKKFSGDDLFFRDQNKRQKDCLWKQGTHYGLENGSLGFIENLHKQK